MYGVTVNMLVFFAALLGRSTAISTNVRMLGWSSCLSSFISRSAVIGKPSFSLCIRIFLSATICPVFFDFAFETSPKVPSPNLQMYSYCWIREQPWKRGWPSSSTSRLVEGLVDVVAMLVCKESGVRAVSAPEQWMVVRGLSTDVQ